MADCSSTSENKVSSTSAPISSTSSRRYHNEIKNKPISQHPTLERLLVTSPSEELEEADKKAESTTLSDAEEEIEHNSPMIKITIEENLSANFEEGEASKVDSSICSSQQILHRKAGMSIKSKMNGVTHDMKQNMFDYKTVEYLDNTLRFPIPEPCMHCGKASLIFKDCSCKVCEECFFKVNDYCPHSGTQCN